MTATAPVMIRIVNMTKVINYHKNKNLHEMACKNVCNTYINLASAIAVK